MPTYENLQTKVKRISRPGSRNDDRLKAACQGPQATYRTVADDKPEIPVPPDDKPKPDKTKG